MLPGCGSELLLQHGERRQRSELWRHRMTDQLLLLVRQMLLLQMELLLLLL